MATNPTPNIPSVIALMPTAIGRDPCATILHNAKAPAIVATPASSDHVGILLACWTPPALAIEASGPSRTSFTAGPAIAKTPQMIPAPAPITISAGEKCAVRVAPEPANMACPNESTKCLPSRKPLGTPKSPPSTPITAPSPSIPQNSPTGLAPIAPMVPITARRSSMASRIVFKE